MADEGLQFYSTPKLREFLRKIETADSVPDSYRNISSKLIEDESVVSFGFLRDAYAALEPKDRLPLYQVLAGSSIVAEKPKPREKSEELKARLQKLQDLADTKEYDNLVHDITKHTQEPEYFSTYKDQLGFGEVSKVHRKLFSYFLIFLLQGLFRFHVALTMFTGFAFGYAVCRSQFREMPAMHAAGGAIGLILGLLLETVLFIVRDMQREKMKDLTKPLSKRE